MRKRRSVALTCAVVGSAFGLLICTGPARAAQEYAGTSSCLECHADMGDTLAPTPHGKKGFVELSGDRGCEMCHGPAKAHSESPDDRALWPLLVAKPAAEQARVCQQCHSGGEQFFWKDGTHEHRGLTCTTCHSVHQSKSQAAQLKAHSEQEQCFECHRDVRAETWKRSHHPIREGKIACSDCHNPHGSTTEKMIREVSVNEQCYKCHTEKRGPFLWEHAPVRESCLNCHSPHGSNHFKLQKTSAPFLCQQCHSNTRHPGTLYDGATLADSLTPSNREFARGCPNCHAAVHGSNHPSSPYLGH